MSVNIFYFFPETEEQILEDTTSEIVKLFFNISNFYHHEKFQFYYDSSNITSFIELNDILKNYLEKDVNKLRVKLHKISAKDILNHNIVDFKYDYLQWNLNTFTVDNCVLILKEVSERNITYPEDKNLLINFNNSIKHCRNKILVFKEGKEKNSFPNKFIHVDFVSDLLELELWLNTYDKSSFSLLNRALFLRTSLIQHGKPVFQEISTKRYWYLDNFHKNEYEVYNSQKKHIGVSDLNGIIDYSKIVSGRTFD